ncbi:hypothetical protein DPMN_013881 [Dreissena polymorpha]|uniref:Uncharacterized protein n=1 Tax=Dreissena polymorpha TaxID=45954 RepID=A0A9D4S4Q4_DREPO|nr:hypothetical protein DPMN_013881 [Dreissena polymorpha]
MVWGSIVRWYMLEVRVEDLGQYSSLGKAGGPCGSSGAIHFAGIGWRSVWRVWGSIVRCDMLEFLVGGLRQYSWLGKAGCSC